MASASEAKVVHEQSWGEGPDAYRVRWWSDGWWQNWNYLAKKWLPSNRMSDFEPGFADLELARLAAEVERLRGERDVQKAAHLDAWENFQRVADEANQADARIEALEGALEFYADPESYVAIGFFPDPPCGDFAEDFSEVEDAFSGAMIRRPGRRARAALESECEPTAERQESSRE